MHLITALFTLILWISQAALASAFLNEEMPAKLRIESSCEPEPLPLSTGRVDGAFGAVTAEIFMDVFSPDKPIDHGPNDRIRKMEKKEGRRLTRLETNQVIAAEYKLYTNFRTSLVRYLIYC